MFLALKSLSSYAHSPWCQPVSQQKITITKPLQLWLINLLLGLQRSFWCTRYQTAVKMCQVHCYTNKTDFICPYNSMELSIAQDATSCDRYRNSQYFMEPGGGGSLPIH
jgi:hypothetical protein